MPPVTPRAGVSSVSPARARGRGIPVDPLAQSLASEYLVEQKEQRAAAARAQRAARPWRRILSIVAIVSCGAVWLIPSLGTRPAPAVSAQRRDAGARVSLFLAAQRVREYERTHGRLPHNLSQAGVSDTRMAYRLTSKDDFTLSLSHDGGHWNLSSSAADTAYMRDAISRLGIVPKPK